MPQGISDEYEADGRIRHHLRGTTGDANEQSGIEHPPQEDGCTHNAREGTHANSELSAAMNEH